MDRGEDFGLPTNPLAHVGPKLTFDRPNCMFGKCNNCAPPMTQSLFLIYLAHSPHSPMGGGPNAMTDHRKSSCDTTEAATVDRPLGDDAQLGDAEKQKAEVGRFRPVGLKRANVNKPTLAERRLLSLTAFNRRWGKGSNPQSDRL